ncbi:transposase [Xanthobacter versatilis]|uniref:transposase n=1 Tax=Xanthobacter autotrophicus (strain ATCC BAA-1158 / Py2) TaxID=78245 RepID=UPI00372D2A1A
MHLKTDFEGRPIAFHPTGGEAGDSRIFKLRLDLGPDITPRAAVADKGYDAKAERAIARAQGITPAIMLKSNAEDRQAFFPKALHRGHARVERRFGKRFKRIALALNLILIKSVHTGSGH